MADGRHVMSSSPEPLKTRRVGYSDIRKRVWSFRGEYSLPTCIRFPGPASGGMVWVAIGYPTRTVLARIDDLSLIKNIWSWVTERLARHPSPANIVEEVWQRLEATWNKLTISVIQAQFDCMPKRVKVILAAGVELFLQISPLFGLAIHQNDHQARRRFVEWAQNEIAVVPDFHKRILFSDEAHFWLNGYVNKQNCRIWSEANPQVYVETPLHPEKLTVWCALWAGGILLQKR
ncbi:hypothetical protein TNCV_3905561 [Trichonephila clavipes]|nr:hypothetical protein TNCV_3905561 [Trichonephila clavipes]